MVKLNFKFHFYLKKYSVLNRRCTNDTIVKDLKVPLGMVIGVDVLSLHYDPQYWPDVDPNEFYPLR